MAGGIDLGSVFKNVIKDNVANGQQVPSGNNPLGGLFGKIREGVQEAGQLAGNVAKVTGAKAILNTQYPDSLPLTQSKGMTQFVENGLTALDLFKGKPDGKPGGNTMDGINALREKAGQPPLDKAAMTITNQDVGLMVEALARKDTPHAQTVLNNSVSTLTGLTKDFPKPLEPAKAPEMSPGG